LSATADRRRSLQPLFTENKTMIKQLIITILVIASSIIYAEDVKTKFKFPEVGYGKEIKAIVEIDIDGVWDVKKIDQKSIITSIHSFLSNVSNDKLKNGWTRKSTKNILKNFTKYHVQCVGVIIDNKKKIWMNFLPNDCPVESNMIICMDDGGFWYWQVIIDPETGKCTNLSINGEA